MLCKTRLHAALQQRLITVLQLNIAKANVVIPNQVLWSKDYVLARVILGN